MKQSMVKRVGSALLALCLCVSLRRQRDFFCQFRKLSKPKLFQ